MLQENNKEKVSWWLIVAFSIVPLIASIVSTIHVVRFFELANPTWMSYALAFTYELGSISTLAGIVAMASGKVNKNTIWFIFILLTLFQIVGNTYFTFSELSTNISKNSYWINDFTQLFGLEDAEPQFIKRVMAFLIGGFLPAISLFMLHILINYVMITMGLKEPYSYFKKLTPKNEEKKSIDHEEKNELLINDIMENKFDNLKENEEQEENDQSILSDGFLKYINEQKMKIDGLKDQFLELLAIFYNEGQIQIGQELPKYGEFVKMVDLNKYPENKVKMFLSCCNYLDICRVSDSQKIALQSYDQAKETLKKYLSWGK